jgi:hypothetical protein
LEATADLPPEVIEFDNQIPLIAVSGTDRRLHPPPELLEQVHDHLEREAELHDLRHGSQTHSEVRAKLEAERLGGSGDQFPRWSVDAEAAADEVPADAQGDPTTQPQTPRSLIPEDEGTSRTGVSGPSFLGLTDDRASEFADEEAEPESHLRRNIALAVFAAVAILAGIQWRSIRDYGQAYLQNGSMTLPPQEKAAAKNPPAVAADNTSQDLGLPPASPTAGAPQAVQGSPNANHNLPVQQAKTTPAQTALEASTSRPPAMSAPAGDHPDEARDSVAKLRAYPPVTSRGGRTVPGADEMNRAAKASDAEARAAWLWRAVGKGNPQAPVELATMYELGNGVVRSCDQAQLLLRSAAAKGNGQAKLSLQQMRVRGGCASR